MKRTITLLAIAMFVLCAPLSAQAPADTCKHTITGDLEIVPFSSFVFENTRSLRIWLPPGYHDAANAQKRYPVLYMLDGQNLFDACTAYDKIHEWEIDETLTRLIAAGEVPPMIVVGIDHAGPRRAIEYLPYPDIVQDAGGPEVQGKRFPTFMAEVVGWANDHYRTLKGPESAGIGGSSYGGVAALYALLMRPDLFSKGIVESATLWVGNAQLIRDTSPLPQGPSKVFFGFGGKEAPRKEVNDALIELVHMMEHNLKSAMLQPTQVMTVIDPDAMHRETPWAQRFPQAVKFLFGKPPEESGGGMLLH